MYIEIIFLHIHYIKVLASLCQLIISGVKVYLDQRNFRMSCRHRIQMMTNPAYKILSTLHILPVSLKQGDLQFDLSLCPDCRFQFPRDLIVKDYAIESTRFLPHVPTLVQPIAFFLAPIQLEEFLPEVPFVIDF